MLFDVQRSASKPAATNRDFRAKSSVRWYVEQELLKSGGTWENHELHHLPQVRKRNNATVPNEDHFRAKFATGVSISIFLPELTPQYSVLSIYRRPVSLFYGPYGGIDPKFSPTVTDESRLHEDHRDLVCRLYVSQIASVFKYPCG